MLRIHLLGEFRVYRDNELVAPAEWHTRQARQLLKILLTEPNQIVSSERLIELLWPESDETAGMSLRSAINALRSVLEPKRPAHGVSSYVPRGSSGYKFVLPKDGSVWIDKYAFEEQLEAALAVGNPRQAIPALTEVLKLYVGDYLAEDEAEGWTWVERERLRERYLYGMTRLAEQQYAQNQLEAAIATCRKAQALAPLSEPLYRLIMRCQAELGDIAGALATFERCRQMLSEELGVDPSAPTLQLHSAILQGDLAKPRLQPQPEISQNLNLSKPYVKKPETPPVFSTFSSIVGRKTELARLLQLFSQVKERETRTVALIGEAGVGKSTLAQHFLERLQTTTARVLSVTCQSVEEKVAFAALTTLLGSWLHEAEPEELASLPRTMLAQLAAVTPGLYGRVSELPSVPFINAEHAYSSLIAAVVEFFVALSQAHPLVLVWDDVQWADESTLRVINRLANLQGVSLLMLLTLRSEDLDENQVLMDTIRTLQRNSRITSVNLTRFTVDEVAEYLRSHQIKKNLSAQKLHQLVLGNALFLSEAVRVLEEGDDANPAAMTAILTSASDQIRDVVLARLARLPQDAIALLELAAMVARPFALDLIRPELSEADQTALELLLNRRFLVDVTVADDHDIHLAFGHSLVGQIIYAECSPIKRRQLHLQVADNMVRYYANHIGRRAAEIADHYRKAGPIHALKVLRYEIAAGDYARQTVSFQQALAHYQAAAEILEAATNATNPELEQWRGRLYNGMAMAYESLLAWQGVQESYHKLWDWAERQGDVRLAGSSALHIVFTRSLMGYLPESQELGRSFLAHFEKVEASENGEAQRSLQIILTVLRHWLDLLTPTENTAFANETWPPTLRQIDFEIDWTEIVRLFDPLQAAYILTEYGRSLLLYGKLAEAETCLKASVRISDETKQLPVWVIAAMHLSRLYRSLGDASKALSWYCAIMERTANLPEANWVLTWPLLNQAYNFIYDGKLAEAAELLQKLEIELSSNSHFLSHRYSVQIGLGILEQAKGHNEQAQNLLQEVMANLPLLYIEAYILAKLTLAQIAVSQGRLEEALAQLQTLLQVCGERGLVEFYNQVGQETVRLLTLSGDHASADALLQQLGPL